MIYTRNEIPLRKQHPNRIGEKEKTENRKQK